MRVQRHGRWRRCKALPGARPGHRKNRAKPRKADIIKVSESVSVLNVPYLATNGSMAHGISLGIHGQPPTTEQVPKAQPEHHIRIPLICLHVVPNIAYMTFAFKRLDLIVLTNRRR